MRKLILVSALMLASAACGGSSDSGKPVKMQALTGTIQGKAFAATIGLAKGTASSTSRTIDIYSKMVGCMDNPVLADGEAEILLTVDPWTDGNAYALNFDLGNLSNAKTVTYVVQQGMTPDNLIISTGRVEVQSAGGMGTNGTLGIRATDSTYGSVEGTVPILNCAM